MIRLLAAAVLLVCGGTGCKNDGGNRGVGGLGDPGAGKQLLRTYGCYSCHTVPGVTGANARVGPPLDRLSNQLYIAGAIPNTPENLVQWIRFPRAVNPGTAMPQLNVTEQHARAIAAYLYKL